MIQSPTAACTVITSSICSRSVAFGLCSTPSRAGRRPQMQVERARVLPLVLSAGSLLDELANLRLVGGRQLGQRECRRPHVAVVEVRRVVEAERRVPDLELL